MIENIIFDVYGTLISTGTGSVDATDIVFDRKSGSTTDNYPLMENIGNTILKKIPQIFTSESLRVYKPDKKFYREILYRTGWKPEECLFVGDSIEEDILGPKDAGMKTVFINRKGIANLEVLSSADFVITSMEELMNVLEKVE